MHSNLFVIVLGLGTVFLGLIVIIFLCKLMSLLVGSFENKQASPLAKPSNSVSIQQNDKIDNKQQLLAAISAAVAEDLGTDFSAIRIHSIKRV